MNGSNNHRVWRPRFTQGLVVLLLALAGLTLLDSRPAYAATITVDGTCTLADAITAANTDAATGSCLAGSGADTIDVTVDVTLTSAVPTISSQIILNGNGHTIARDPAAPEFRILDLNGANLTLNQATIAGGRVIGSNDDPELGGGIKVNNSSTLVVDNSTIRDNEAAGGGGAIVIGNAAGGNTVTINNSTIRDNSTTVLSAVTADCAPGAATLTINNSTISGNASPSGGVSLFRASGNAQCQGTIDSSTITNNTATGTSGTSAGLSVEGATVTVRNSIIAGQTNAGDCQHVGSGGITSAGYNISSDASCNFTGTGDQQNVGAAALRLGPLANSGGPTETHALLPGSVAINAGDTSLTTDQRGIARPQGAADDIGAYEWQSGEGACTYANPTTASTEAELNAAILCFSQQTAAGTYQLNLGADINLTASTTEIRNPATGVVLALDGGGYTVNGQNIPGVRPFAVAPDTTASMNDLTVSGGRGIGLALAGGILNRGALTVSNSTISGNTAVSGGGIYNLAYNFAATLTVSNSTISGNSAGNGGGIYNDAATLTVTHSTIDANTTSGSGSGVYAVRNGSVTITDSTISGNTANKDGGGINLDGAYSPGAGTLTVERSTISGNVATTNGGGIDLYLNTGQVTIANSTFSGNTAGSKGGGIRNFNFFGPTVAIVSSTFSGNTAGSGGGGGLRLDSPTNVENTIVANSTSGGDCVGKASASSINNLVEDGSNACGLTNGSNGNIVGADPNLGALASNGGPTQTMALLTGSPAIDAGDDAVCAAAPVNNLDQRGATRPQGTHCDIGAFEALAMGTIVITKSTAPAGGTGFNFTDNIAAPNSFTLDDGQDHTFTNIPTGTYTVTEAAPVGGRLTGLVCDDDNSATPSTVDLPTRTATVNLDPGETVTCHFTNSEDDLVVIQKLTNPAGGTGFNFGGDLGAFTLDDGELHIASATPGTYTVTEANPGPDYDVTEVLCWVFPADDNLPPTVVNGDTTTRSVTFSLTGPGQAAFCGFTNTRRTRITIVKEADPPDGTDFDFTLGGDASDTFTLDDAVPDDNDGIPNSETYNLPAGDYSVIETIPSGWLVTNLVCQGQGVTGTRIDSDSGEAYFTMQPGDEATCTFHNARAGSLTVVKNTEGGDATFVFDNSVADDDIRVTTVNGTGQAVIDDLAPGDYYVVERPLPGWVAVDASCSNNDDPSNIHIDAGEQVTCTFVNRRVLPTAVRLRSLSAARGAGGVQVRWETEVEVDLAGFRVERSLVETGPFEPVTPTLIPATGGGAYAFKDVKAPAGAAWYRLVFVATDGDQEPSEPVAVAASFVPGQLYLPLTLR